MKFIRKLSEYQLNDFTSDVPAFETYEGVKLMVSELPKRKREIYLSRSAITLLPTLSNFLLPAFGQPSAERILDSGYYAPFISGYKSGTIDYLSKRKLYAKHLTKTCQAWIAFFKSKPTIANLEKLYALIKGFPFSYKDGVCTDIVIDQDGFDYIKVQTLTNTISYIAVGAKWSGKGVSTKVVGAYLQVKSLGLPTLHGYGAAVEGNNDFWIPIKSTDPQLPTELNTGAVGVALNGVPIVMRSDTIYMSQYPDWRQNIVTNETLDAHGGTILDDGTYAYVKDPKDMYTKDATKHSPLIGYAFDGYPIYGPYGYVSNDGEDGQVTRMTTSYHLRSGSRDSEEGVPPGTYDGTYIQDYEFRQGSGILDENNGRFSSTPEYPDGIYHYHITIDSSGAAEYPYILSGYKGVPNLVRGLIKNISVDNLSSEVITYELPTGGKYLTAVGEPIKKFDILMSGISMHDYITSPSIISGIISREGTQQQFDVSVIKDFDGNKGLNVGTLSEAVIYTGSVLQPQSTQADTDSPGGGANAGGNEVAGGGGSY